MTSRTSAYATILFAAVCVAVSVTYAGLPPMPTKDDMTTATKFTLAHFPNRTVYVTTGSAEITSGTGVQ